MNNIQKLEKIINNVLYRKDQDMNDNNDIKIENYNLFFKKHNEIIEISIVEIRGIHKCEDNIFFIKFKNHDVNKDHNSCEIWDLMNYVKNREDTVSNSIITIEKAINKISKMRKILQIHHLHKPSLIDSPELLFNLHPYRKYIIKYNHDTKRIAFLPRTNNENYEYL